MDHPFLKIKPEYTQLLSVMQVKPEKQRYVDEIAAKILGLRTRFEPIQKAINVPVVFSGPSFYREADLNFSLSPAQGDPWRKVSTHVPKGEGPFSSWYASALAAYQGEHLDKIKNWTWELICYYGELFNGFGYRDAHHMHSPYLWGGTNIQTIGKFTSDHGFDSTHMDEQLGIIPIAKRIVEVAPDLGLAPILDIPTPQPSGLATSEDPKHDVKYLQEALNKLGFEIDIDGSYGRETKRAVAAFQKAYGLIEDWGYAGAGDMQAIEKAVENLKSDGYI